VLAPVLIALLMIEGGMLLACNDRRVGAPLWPSKWALGVSGLGAVLALYVFMADAIRAMHAANRCSTCYPSRSTGRCFSWRGG